MDEPLTYQTPAGVLLGEPPQIGGIRRAQVQRRGVLHDVVVLKTDGDGALVSCATFCGWVRSDELIEHD